MSVYCSVLRLIGYFCVVLCFFFFKQKTAYEMRISDWSSDVCSSYLRLAGKPDSWRVGFPSFAPRPPRKSEGGGECPWVRNKGGGVGRRPMPGDIRIQGHSPPAPGRSADAMLQNGWKKSTL